MNTAILARVPKDVLSLIFKAREAPDHKLYFFAFEVDEKHQGMFVGLGNPFVAMCEPKDLIKIRPDLMRDLLLFASTGQVIVEVDQPDQGLRVVTIQEPEN